MSRDRFDKLWRYVTVSDQPNPRPAAMGTAGHKWRLVDGFAKNLNDHRVATFSPCHRICIDESIIRRYGLNGGWINVDLPQYFAMDRKPENGCEIRNSCCGVSGVLLHLKIVNAATGVDLGDTEDDQGFPYEAKVLKALVVP